MIGIDLVSIERIQKLQERFGDKALQKYLSPEEILLVKNHATAAGFYAAKEAVSRAAILPGSLRAHGSFAKSFEKVQSEMRMQ